MLSSAGVVESCFRGGNHLSLILAGLCEVCFMAKGSKSKYSDKQKRQAEHIEESYEKRGASKKTAEKRAWQTVNKQTGGGEKSGGGRKASPAAKRAARKESGQRGAASRKIGTRRVQKTITKHKASSSAKTKK
jgi:plasmid stabilization system protein ParE